MSPGTDAESDLQAWHARRLDELGFAVDSWQLDLDDLAAHPGHPGVEAPRAEGYGLVGTWGPAGIPALVLQGHVDVVPTGDRDSWRDRDPWSGAVAGGAVHGRGACDMKAGLAANLAVARALAVAGVKVERPLALHAVISEEDGGLGAFATMLRGHRGGAAVITEPTSGRVVVANAGALTFELRVAGQATQGSSRYAGHSAIEAFLPVHAALLDLERERNARVDPLFADNPLPYPISVGTVRAGDWASSIPDLLVAQGRLGVALGESPTDARAALECTVAGAGARDPWLRDHPVTVTWPGGQFASGQLDAAHPLVGQVGTAIRDVEGRDAGIGAAPYAAICGCTPAREASRRCTTDPATSAWPTAPANRSRSTRSCASPARSPCSRHAGAAPTCEPRPAPGRVPAPVGSQRSQRPREGTTGMAVTGTRFSIVSAVHNVARYLPDYIASIEAQTFPLDRVRVVAVDDGSDDESRAVLEDWARRRPELVTVLPKQNGGQGSARNLGVQHATGEWVTFLDPDDAIVADYLEIVDRTIAASPGLSMVATNRIFLDDATGERRDTHPLRRMFADGDRVVDLDLEPDHFHGSAPAAFVRRDVLIEHGIVFDDRIRPNFEDGAFCSRYLLASGTSQVAFLQSARYLYRKRADGTSTLQGSLRDPARFTSVPRHGYLSLLRDAAPEGWYAPEWLQQFVLYEIYGYFKSDAAMSNSFSVATGDVGAEFIDILREIAQYLDPRVVESTKTEPVWRDILQHLDSERWVTPYAVVTRYDQAKRLARVVYRYRGPAPHETFVCLGEPTPVRHGKVRRITFFGHTLLHERIAWIPVTTTTRLLLDGTAVPLRHDWADAGQTTMRRHALRSPFLPAGGKRDLGREDELLLQLAGSRAVRKLYRNAWVIMDRVVAAGDNGERLFRHLRDHRKDINAWFVIDKDAPEWDKLKADGYDHLVAYGSRRWKLLMLNCAHLVASHTERAVRRPPEILRLTEPTWTFTFLQHGVIKDDLSRWLNPKPIDVFVTSTPGEYESIAGDGSPYVFTGKEVTLSGLPRFDRLRELANAATDRNLVLVCPTWRIWLSPDYDGISQRAVVADFADSEYAQAWLGFLRDESLRDTLAAQGLRLGFLPHPNIQPVLRELDLPDWVEPMSHDDHDVQELIARTALMVTDYSSMSFNAGYVDTPVVYYQFDADRVFGGGHIGVKGYYDYERDGFGPVTTTLAGTVSAVSDIVTAPGRAPAAEYTERFARTFPHRDGRCCERVTAAIEALTDKS